MKRIVIENIDQSESKCEISSGDIRNYFSAKLDKYYDELSIIILEMNAVQYAGFMKAVIEFGQSCFGDELIDAFNSNYPTEVISMVEKEAI